MNIYMQIRASSRTIAVKGSSSEFLELAGLLMERKEVKVDSKKTPNEYYPVALDRIRFEIQENANLLSTELVGNDLLIFGGPEAMRKLAQGFINFFTSPVKAGTHFHLDYFEDNQILEQTDIHLIFETDAAA
jgi:hypothetical protein